MEKETGRVAVCDSEPGTDCPPPDPNPNPQARPPPVPGPGPRLSSPGDAALARRRPFPSRTPIPNLYLGFNGDLGRGVHPSPPRYPLPAETRAAWRPQQFQPNPNLPSHFRVPNPNPDLESHGSEHPPLRPDLGRGLRPSLPGVLPGFGDRKIPDWRKTLEIWEFTLKMMINDVESRRRELRHFADQILQAHRENLNAGEVTWNNRVTSLNQIMKATEVVMWSYLMVCQNPIPQQVIRTAPYFDPECMNTRSIVPTHTSRTFSDHAELPSEPSDGVSRVEKHLTECHQWLKNLHRLLTVDTKQTSVHLLPVFSDGHNFLIQVVAQVQALYRESRQFINNLESVQSQGFGDQHQQK